MFVNRNHAWNRCSLVGSKWDFIHMMLTLTSIYYECGSQEAGLVNIW